MRIQTGIPIISILQLYVCIYKTLFLKGSVFKSTSKIYTCIFAPATYIMNAYLDICDSDEFIVCENYVAGTYKY